jgi:peptidoglycan/xylan/chitin deacetylase (PgdA/CDA1 family)
LGFEIKILQLLFPAVLFTCRSQGVYLTFDDGPHPRATPLVLDILKSYGIPAVFFVLGENAVLYPELLSGIKESGHYIGNHSYSHENLFFRSRSYIRESIMRTEEALRRNSGISSRLFRPPYGFFNRAVLNITEEMKMTCMLWNVDCSDYLPRGRKDIVGKTAAKVTGGSILLLHDNESTSRFVNAYLPPLIESLLDKGFKFEQPKI